VREALEQTVAGDLRLYPDPAATRLRTLAAEVYGVPPDGIVVGNGSDELIGLLIRAVVDPGGAVAYPVPTYSLYATVVALHGARAIEVPFPDDWSLPVDELRQSGAALTFVCNPNSPSGTAASIATIASLAGAVPGVVCVDEAYADFAEADALGILACCPNVVVLRTFSKSFSLAGLRVGLAFGHPELIEGLRTLKDSYNVNRLTQVAAEAALSDLPYVHAVVDRIRTTRDRLARGLERLGYRVPASQANFVFAERHGCDQGPVAARLAAEGILVRHFPTPRLGDALRITVGTDDEIDRLLETLASMGPTVE
jgi:histidinol-phosphate aminotransferase